MARIEILDDNEFSLLLNTLSADVVHAHFHYQLLRALQDAHDQYSEVFNETRTFWYLTLEAHQGATLFRLGRIFDQHKHALSLGNWLMTIRSNLHFFDEPDFRRRLQGNAFVDSLAKDSRKPEERELDRDISLVVAGSKKGVDESVRKFIDIRNKYLAHRDPAFMLPSQGPQKVADLLWADIERLLNLAAGLLNKYSSLFAASVSSTTMVGQDDYKYVLETVRARINSHKVDVDAEMKKYSGKSTED